MITIDFPRFDFKPDLSKNILLVSDREWSWDFNFKNALDYDQGHNGGTTIWLDGNQAFCFDTKLSLDKILEVIEICEVGLSLGIKEGTRKEQCRIGRFLGLPVI